MRSSASMRDMSMNRDETIDATEVWGRVQQFARIAKDHNSPIYTLGDKPVRNFITNVTETYIERKSDDGKKGKTHLLIRKSHIEDLWSQLVMHGRVRKGVAPYFASALLNGSLPELVKNEGSELILQQSRNGVPLSADILSLVERNIEATTKEALINARVGQGAFRSQVLQLWGQCCAVTQSITFEAIRASHIKPWRISTDQERLDANNGLPLTASLDALFDSGLISFEPSGNLVISPSMSAAERQIYLLDGRSLVKQPTAKTAEYLAFHRACVFRK